MVIGNHVTDQNKGARRAGRMASFAAMSEALSV
jgi:hypothetical protein